MSETILTPTPVPLASTVGRMTHRRRALTLLACAGALAAPAFASTFTVHHGQWAGRTNEGAHARHITFSVEHGKMHDWKFAAAPEFTVVPIAADHSFRATEGIYTLHGKFTSATHALGAITRGHRPHAHVITWEADLSG